MQQTFVRLQIGLQRAADGKGQCEPFEVVPGATSGPPVTVVLR